MEDVMNRKAIILFVLSAGILAAALVFDGVSHRRAANNAQTTSQNAVATQPASQPADASTGQTNVQTDAQAGTQTEVQPADSADPNAQAAEPGQDAATDDATQTQDNADAPAADAAQAPQPIVVPAGTTLTVRLGEDLGSSTSTTGQSFSATLDRDVVVGGQTVIAAGAGVTGKVVSAKPD